MAEEREASTGARSLSLVCLRYVIPTAFSIEYGWVKEEPMKDLSNDFFLTLLLHKVTALVMLVLERKAFSGKQLNETALRICKSVTVVPFVILHVL
jgi:hypothetical protein